MNAGATIAVSTDPAAARYRCQDLPERYPVLVTSPPLTPVAAPASLDAFLAGVGPRAFRFAEAGLRQRDGKIAVDQLRGEKAMIENYRRQRLFIFTSRKSMDDFMPTQLASFNFNHCRSCADE